MARYIIAWGIEGKTEIEAQSPAEANLKFYQISKSELAENDGELESDVPFVKPEPVPVVVE